MRVTGWRCAVCGETVDIATSFPWRCPNSTATDRHHVLEAVDGVDTPPGSGVPTGAGSRGVRADDDLGGNPFLRYDSRFAWAAYAEANGIDALARRRLVLDLDRAVERVAGVGFTATPFGRSGALSDALGFSASGGVWVKDETGSVGGSQKARHLFTILLHLRAAELLGHLSDRPPLAIASCGNAALAAATLAQAADWPIDVYVPTWMSDGFAIELDRLGARVHRCERRAQDAAGDPAMLRFREAVSAGAIPFTVQGPENALALDGGRTIGWEIVDQLRELQVELLDRIFVQVGGGAFAACVGAAHLAGRFHAVQAEGCAPLARAWSRAREAGTHARADLTALLWPSVMTPWDDPRSIADGILDDETYDWIGVFRAIDGSGGPIVASESSIVTANGLARSAGFDVSPTGSAGLAGLVAIIDSVEPTEKVAVVMSGVGR